MTIDLQQDFFSLFGLPVQYQLDVTLLEQKFRSLQSQVHPDKFTHLSEAERRISMQWATQVNEAYQTLRNTLRRARYFLLLQGIDTEEESNTAMPVDFLVQQMEWRESLADAIQLKDEAELEAIEDKVNKLRQKLEQELANGLSSTHEYVAASGIVRKLKFIEKIEEEIASAFDELDN